MYDVVIVGGGPGGSTTAKHIRRNSDKSVAIIEKEGAELDPHCAGGIAKHMAGKMKTQIFGSEVESEVKKVTLSTRDNDYSLHAEDLGVDYLGMTLDRKEFDTRLLQEAVNQGAKLHCNEEVTEIEDRGDSYRVETESGFNYYAETVVGADGWKSLVGQQLGLDTILSDEDLAVGYQKVIEMDDYNMDEIKLVFDEEWSPGGYIWMFPIQGAVRVGIGVPATDGAPNPNDKLEDFIDEWGIEGEVKDANAGMIPVGKPCECYTERGALVGDSARHTSPLHGGGLAHAILDGEALGETIAEDNHLSEYPTKVWDDYLGRLENDYKVKKWLYDSDNLDKLMEAIQGYKPKSININKELPRLLKHIALKHPTMVPSVLKGVYL